MAWQGNKDVYGISNDAETTVGDQSVFMDEQQPAPVAPAAAPQMPVEACAISRDMATNESVPAAQPAPVKPVASPAGKSQNYDYAVSRDAATDEDMPAAQPAPMKPVASPAAKNKNHDYAVSRDAATDEGNGIGGEQVGAFATNNWVVNAANQGSYNGQLQPSAVVSQLAQQAAAQPVQQVQFMDGSMIGASAAQPSAPQGGGPVFFSSDEPAPARRDAPVRTPHPQQPVPVQPAPAPAPTPAPRPISSNAHRSKPSVAPQQPPTVQSQPKGPENDRYYTYNEHRDKAKQQYDAQLAAYNAHKAQMKRKIWIVPVFIAVVAVMAILIAALLSVPIMLLFLLLVALGVTILAAMGKLKWLKFVKKPKIEKFEMEMPEMAPIHSVHICLRSKNLATPVEITIRDAVQYIGSDDKLCRVPLHFKGVSHRHLIISCQTKSGNSQYFVTDQGSKNGTKLNGQVLKPYETYSLNFGDVITIARLYEFQVCSDAQ